MKTIENAAEKQTKAFTIFKSEQLLDQLVIYFQAKNELKKEINRNNLIYERGSKKKSTAYDFQKFRTILSFEQNCTK